MDLFINSFINPFIYTRASQASESCNHPTRVARMPFAETLLRSRPVLVCPHQKGPLHDYFTSANYVKS